MRPIVPDRLRQLLVVCTLVAMLAVNGLSVLQPLNGRSQQQIARDFDVLFVPADYTFAVWGLIYVSLIAYVTYQLLPRQKDRSLHRYVGLWFVVNGIGNCAWIYFWHYGMYEWSVGAMLVVLESLVAIYARLKIGRNTPSRNDILFVHIPFSLYLGWITVATVANVTAWLDFIQWDGFGLEPEIWAIAMVVIATLIAGLVAVRHRDLPYALVIVWGFVGLAVKQRDSLTLVLTIAIMSAVLLLAVFAAPRKISTPETQ